MGYNDALIAGLAQGIAITPGISRSGITIVVLLFLGIEKEFSAKFSFLLAVPVIMGASLVEFRRISNLPPGIILPMGLGFIISAISGFLALSILLSTVKKGRLSWFAYYCWIIGIIVIILETVLSLF